MNNQLYTYPKKPIRRRLFTLFLILAVVIIAAAIAYRPLDDHFTLSSASPAMKTLALEAGLSREGELIFLRTDPQLVSASQLAGDCGDKAGTGFIEQGCFVQTSGGQENIYLRQMPADLHGVEIVTAAHEMLHAAYASLNQPTKNTIDKEVSSEYKSLDDKALQARMADYARSEPGARDNELHSILGTEFSPLPAGLTHYYQQYFTNRQLVVNANKQVNQKFDTLKNQIDQQQAAIKSDEAQATELYQNSAADAAAGNAQGDNYYYGQYSQKINAVNTLIDQYNESITQYDALSAEYDGQSVTSLPTLPTQAS